MKSSRLLMLLVLAVIGYGTLAALFVRLNPAARWGYRLDRDQAITKAGEVATRYGPEASKWRPLVTADYQGDVAYYVSQHPNSAAASALSPVTTSVLFVDSGSERHFRVDLAADGRLIGFAHHSSSKSEGEPPVELTRQTAETALRELVGVAASQFSLVAEAPQGKEGIRFTWEQTIPDQRDLKFQVVSLVHGATVKELSRKPNFTPRFVEEFKSRRAPFRFMPLLVNLSVGLIAIVFFILSWARKRIDHRPTLVLAGATFLLTLLMKFLGSGLDEFLAGFLAGLTSQINLGYRVNLLIGVFSLIIGILIGYFLRPFILWEAGQAPARQVYPGQFASFALLLKGKFLSRSVAGSIAAGLLLGGVVKAAPYLVAASGLFPRVEVGAVGPESFVAQAPSLVCFDEPVNFRFFTLFGFLIPLLGAYVRRPWVCRVLGLVVGWVWLANTELRGSVAASLAAGGALVIITDLIFRRFDFLTLIAAGLAAGVTVQAAALLAQLSASLRTSAISALSALAVLLGGALVVAWKGREVRLAAQDQEQLAGTSQALRRAERERLKAEFGVARRAQEQMLPALPPAIPGYGIAAVCRPAREVGGDLYDFIPLADGRWGVVVADVSGKGVPAALYMTLTKGLLASVAKTRSDPGEILREVNRHLYEVCRRKVFVTLFLGVIEPASRTLLYSRAGHNPPVWRHAASRATQLLRASGVGLGLNGGKLFDRSLAVERIQLESQDALFFYSDGITEAMNAQGEEYGEERLLAATAKTDRLSAEATLDAILADVGTFLGQTHQQDDMTLVVIRVAGD